ncbi:uncharacterized protein LOC131218896 [Magnolia sinica]|uniref:uncharacterized protein LOC131218896 n=1 Tax=Magnolia sinica TaxID=86752 RepID=UPI00265A1E6D|nr:uncharacterized protein LOC131218896 [Magnolia sinica]XP_058069756.1 uncharacterized protein LOC131218896 [Magnolia sinica]
MVIIAHPNKLAPDGMVGVLKLVDRCYTSTKNVLILDDILGFDSLLSNVHPNTKLRRLSWFMGALMILRELCWLKVWLPRNHLLLPWILITSSIISVWLLLLLLSNDGIPGLKNWWKRSLRLWGMDEEDLQRMSYLKAE